MGKLRPGFTREAEALAEDLRAELGIGNIARLDPLMLASDLEIPVLTLSQLPTLAGAVAGLDEAIAVLQGPEHAALSAVTVLASTRRLIIHNDRYEPARQASDICHELAHGLLLHQPTPVLDERGCRAWNSAIEAEASYLGGALLVPGKAARWIAKSKLSIDVAAHRFGCSTRMINWRLNESGARRLMAAR